MKIKMVHKFLNLNYYMIYFFLCLGQTPPLSLKSNASFLTQNLAYGCNSSGIDLHVHNGQHRCLDKTGLTFE